LGENLVRESCSLLISHFGRTKRDRKFEAMLMFSSITMMA